jgi:small-conductance mechanosensitive channel
MEQLENILLQIKYTLDIPIFKLGQAHLTLWGILIFIILIIVLFYTTGKARKWIAGSLLSRSHLDVGAREAIGSIFGYLALAIGFVIILQTAGIDLSALTILVGSLSIGIGLGLQNITNNFVSGLIILIERPIKVGDRIEFKELNGEVVRIAARATTLLTNDNIAIIVPNSEMISSAVINWSYPTKRVRFNIPVGVSYDSDPELVKTLLLEVAKNEPGVLKTAEPDVLFDSFGDNALNFILRVWTVEFVGTPGVLKSQLNFAISKTFKDHGVEIPFPQREVHIVTN